MRKVIQFHLCQKVSVNFYELVFILIAFIIVPQGKILSQKDDCYAGYKLFKKSEVTASAYSLNDFYSYVNGDGTFDYNDKVSGAGFYFPANSKKALVYTTSLIWIGKQKEIYKSGGAIYNSSLVS
ncbi:MAG: hypothetical protein Q8T08_04695, partial [Ignavibacteria bacterium]|nr:hypothetical protein [Ignavibacteria bacterium]